VSQPRSLGVAAHHAVPDAVQGQVHFTNTCSTTGHHVIGYLVQVLIKRRKKGRNGDTWEVVRARGHLDEVQELRKGGTKLIGTRWRCTAGDA
jgi:hypothetical protein